MATRRTRTITWLRRGLALLLFALIAGLGIIWRIGREATPTTRPLEGTEDFGEGGPPVLGQQVEHTILQDGEPLFEIRGSTSREDETGGLRVEEVELTVFGDEGRTFVVTGRNAVYNPEKKEGRVSGAVEVTTPDGLTMKTSSVTLYRGGSKLETKGTVHFTREGEFPVRGRADALQADLDRRVYVLTGGVEIASRGSDDFLLRATHLAFDDRRHLVRGDGGVDLTWKGQHLQARRLAVQLYPSGGRIQSLLARWDVEGTLQGEETATGGRTRLDIRGGVLSVLMDLEGRAPMSIELTGNDPLAARPGLADVVHTSAENVSLRLASHAVVADFERGTLATLRLIEAASVAELVGPLPGVPIRQACGHEATIEFLSSGGAARATLEDGVDLHELEFQARGERAEVDFLEGELRLHGAPAEVLHEQGDFYAPIVVARQRSGLVHAEGGVRARLTMDDLDAVPLGVDPAGGVTWVTSDEAFLRRRPSSFTFQGDVKAWQGESFLVADQLRGDRDLGALTASGGVESFWVPEAPEGEEVSPYRVKSETLVYREADSILHYVDEVEVLESERRLACDDLGITIGANGQAERMRCEGSVVLDDTRQGRHVESQVAEYDLATRLVVFGGDPGSLAKFSDGEGGRLEGRQLIYDLDEDRLVLDRERSDGQP